MQALHGKEVLTTGEVAKICHVAPRTVSKWFDTGQLRGYRIPGSRDRRIPVEQLVAFMRAHGLPLDSLDGGLCRLLIVDPDAGEELCETLNASGRYQTRRAENGFEAGILAEQFRPHAIVLDISGSLEEGLAICRNIKANSALQATTVIAASLDEDPEKRRQIVERGFDDVLIKPYSAARLAELIDSLTSLVT